MNTGGEESIKDKLKISEAKNRALKTQMENLKASFIIDKQQSPKRKRILNQKLS